MCTYHHSHKEFKDECKNLLRVLNIVLRTHVSCVSCIEGRFFNCWAIEKIGYKWNNLCSQVAIGLNICKFISDFRMSCFSDSLFLIYQCYVILETICLETFSSFGFHDTTFSWFGFQLPQYSLTNVWFLRPEVAHILDILRCWCKSKYYFCSLSF